MSALKLALSLMKIYNRIVKEEHYKQAVKDYWNEEFSTYLKGTPTYNAAT